MIFRRHGLSNIVRKCDNANRNNILLNLDVTVNQISWIKVGWSSVLSIEKIECFVYVLEREYKLIG